MPRAVDAWTMHQRAERRARLLFHQWGAIPGCEQPLQLAGIRAVHKAGLFMPAHPLTASCVLFQALGTLHAEALHRGGGASRRACHVSCRRLVLVCMNTPVPRTEACSTAGLQVGGAGLGFGAAGAPAPVGFARASQPPDSAAASFEAGFAKGGFEHTVDTTAMTAPAPQPDPAPLAPAPPQPLPAEPPRQPAGQVPVGAGQQDQQQAEGRGGVWGSGSMKKAFSSRRAPPHAAPDTQHLMAPVSWQSFECC